MGSPCPTNITTWEDEPLSKGTYIKRRHQDLNYTGTTAGIRQAIDRERLRRGLSGYSWTYPVLDYIHKEDIKDARSALDDIYNNPGNCTTYTTPACQNDYTDEPLVKGVTFKTEHIEEIRQRINELEDDCLSYQISYNTTYNTTYCPSHFTTYNTEDWAEYKAHDNLQYYTSYETKFYNGAYNDNNTTKDYSQYKGDEGGCIGEALPIECFYYDNLHRGGVDLSKTCSYFYTNIFELHHYRNDSSAQYSDDQSQYYTVDSEKNAAVDNLVHWNYDTGLCRYNYGWVNFRELS